MTGTNKSIGGSTLAHELIALEEQNIGIFFAAFAIQFYMNKEMLKRNLNNPPFLIYFGDVEIYASQRVLVKNIINNNAYRLICEKIALTLYDENMYGDKQAHELFLGSIHNAKKAFFIRQIFKQTDQILQKYEFIEDFIHLDIVQLDVGQLYQQLALLPIEEQILILARIFSKMRDGFDNKKKTILESFIENIRRTHTEYTVKGKTKTSEYLNLEMLMKEVVKKNNKLGS